MVQDYGFSLLRPQDVWAEHCPNSEYMYAGRVREPVSGEALWKIILSGSIFHEWIDAILTDKLCLTRLGC